MFNRWFETPLGKGKGKKKTKKKGTSTVALATSAAAALDAPAVEDGREQNGTTEVRQAARSSNGYVRNTGGQGSGVGATGGSGQGVAAGERAKGAAQEAAVLFWQYLKEEDERWHRCADCTHVSS